MLNDNTGMKCKNINYYRYISKVTNIILYLNQLKNYNVYATFALNELNFVKKKENLNKPPKNDNLTNNQISIKMPFLYIIILQIIQNPKTP